MKPRCRKVLHALEESVNSTEETVVVATPKRHSRRTFKYEDFDGRRFGKLTVLEKVVAPKAHAGLFRCKCLCDCGKEKIIRAGRLFDKREVSCGCEGQRLRTLGHSESRSWRGCGEVSSTYWSHTRRRAIKANRAFTLTIQDMSNLLEAQGKKCALSGLPIETSRYDKAVCTASLDRIDSNKGYTPDNVQWVHTDINFMKQDLNEDYFKDLCRRVNEMTSKPAQS